MSVHVSLYKVRFDRFALTHISCLTQTCRESPYSCHASLTGECLFIFRVNKESCSSLSGLWKGFKTNLNSLHVCKMQLLVFTAVWVRVALAVWNQSLVLMMWQTYLFFLPLIVWIKIDLKKTVFLKCICKILFMANVFQCFEKTETHADACRLIQEDIRQRQSSGYSPGLKGALIEGL